MYELCKFVDLDNNLSVFRLVRLVRDAKERREKKMAARTPSRGHFFMVAYQF